MARNLRTRVKNLFRGLGGQSASQQISEDQLACIKTVCIFMGPYRNLTTLTSALLSLHPHCRVLNHAAERVLDDDAINFLSHPSDDRFLKFCKFAIEESQGGKRGDYGGSITLSHAFDHEIMKATYRERYAGQVRKEEVHSVIWKDSQRITNYVRDNELLDPMLDSIKRVRFLMPIRNPLDCAISNHNSRKKEHLSSRGDGLHDVLEAVCGEIAWFQSQKRRQPDRFFNFFENELDEDALRNMASFLELEPTPQWIGDAIRCYQLKPAYEQDADLVAKYRQLVDRHFSDDIKFAESMTRFIA